MRFDGGWVKLHRSILTSDIGRDGTACWIFMLLVMWANRADGRYKGKPLPRGSLITGLAEIEAETGFSRPTICRRLKLLASCQMIVRDVKRSGSIITICNYDKYQVVDGEKIEVSETTVKRSRNDPETILKRSRTPIGELENSRRGEGEKEETLPQPVEAPPPPKKVKPIVPIDPVNLQLGQSWYDFAVKRKPWMGQDKNYSPEKFAVGIQEVRRKKDITADGMRQILNFIEKDDFWGDNALSPNNLLTSRNGGLRKIDSILNKMQPKRDKLYETMAEYAKNGQPLDDPFQKEFR